MREIATQSQDNPEFARVLGVASLRRTPDYAFDIAPTGEEAAGLARLLGADEVRRLRFAGTLRPEAGGWALDGRLDATVIQPCVVTLEPVTSRIVIAVRRRFLPAVTPPVAAVDVLPDADDDDVEPLGDRIDLGLVAIEALALALPAYPRREDAALDRSAFTEGEGDAKPFAALAGLRDRLGGKR